LTAQSDGSYAILHQLTPAARMPQVHNSGMTRAKKLDELVTSVEALLAQLPDECGPELAELRDKVDAGIFEAWTAIAGEGRATLNRAARGSAVQFWVTVGLALLAGATSLLAYRITRPEARLS
jgi:ElaB/YqjD/DUF883 family membrane-anchored ribosome-binding protein